MVDIKPSEKRKEFETWTRKSGEKKPTTITNHRLIAEISIERDNRNAAYFSCYSKLNLRHKNQAYLRDEIWRSECLSQWDPSGNSLLN